MCNLDQFLNLIENGSWHSLRKLSAKSSIPKEKLVALAKMLAETKIIEYKNHEEKVRLKQEWKHIFCGANSEEDNRETAVGTIVLPPKKSIDIQNIQITNLTQKELELGVRINKELKELAIGILE